MLRYWRWAFVASILACSPVWAQQRPGVDGTSIACTLGLLDAGFRIAKSCGHPFTDQEARSFDELRATLEKYVLDHGGAQARIRLHGFMADDRQVRAQCPDAQKWHSGTRAMLQYPKANQIRNALGAAQDPFDGGCL